jgi:DNA polymerase/3'-5' exonuclease PolX
MALKRLHGVGDQTMEKLWCIYNTGELPRVDATGGLQENEKREALRQLCSLWGVAKARAEMMYEQGIRTVDDVRARAAELLSEKERLCLSLHADLVQRVPRAEVGEIERIANEVARGVDDRLIVVATGSYRRGDAESKDVDLLVWRAADGGADEAGGSDDCSAPAVNEALTALLLPALRAHGLITHDLRTQDGSGYGGATQNPQLANKMYMGIVKVGDGPHRRVDIKTATAELSAFSLIFFTGNADFNRFLSRAAQAHRPCAPAPARTPTHPSPPPPSHAPPLPLTAGCRVGARQDQGFKLSSHGLRRSFTDAGGKKVDHGPRLPCATERAVFEKIGVVYREPWERRGKRDVLSEQDRLPWFRKKSAGSAPPFAPAGLPLGAPPAAGALPSPRAGALF